MKHILIAAIPDFAVHVLALCLLACSIQCGSGAKPVVQAGIATLETAICIGNEWVKCKQTGAPDEQCVLNVGKVCEADAATVARVLDSDTRFAVFYKPMCR